jgi:hypothetical protein
LNVHRETLTQYITLKKVESLVVSSLATVTSCIYLSVRIVTKSPKVGPLLIFSISLDRLEPDGAALARSGAELELEWAPVHLQLASLPKYYLMLSKVRTFNYLHYLTILSSKSVLNEEK